MVYNTHHSVTGVTWYLSLHIWHRATNEICRYSGFIPTSYLQLVQLPIDVFMYGKKTITFLHHSVS